MADTVKPPSRRAIVVGIVGGVASGKSAVAEILHQRGFLVIDADRLARAALEEPALRPELRRLFGPGVVDQTGAVDRAAIASVVFADPAALAALEALIHPGVRREILAQLEVARGAGRNVVLDVPLLLERGLVECCDRVLFVAVDDEVRRARARARGMSDADWQRREASQAALFDKRARADAVVDNSGDLAATERAIDEILARWLPRQA